MAEEKAIVYDVEGYEAMTPAIMDLLNAYPGLSENDAFTFSILSENGGKAMFPNNGAIIQLERVSVTGKVYQECLYPCFIMYRSAGLSEARKAAVKEWLDNLGRWLEGQTITIDEMDYALSAYPTLTGNRKIKSISRQSPAFLNTINENKTEDWIMDISVRYTNEFIRRNLNG